MKTPPRREGGVSFLVPTGQSDRRLQTRKLCRSELRCKRGDRHMKSSSSKLAQSPADPPGSPTAAAHDGAGAARTRRGHRARGLLQPIVIFEELVGRRRQRFVIHCSTASTDSMRWNWSASNSASLTTAAPVGHSVLGATATVADVPRPSLSWMVSTIRSPSFCPQTFIGVISLPSRSANWSPSY